MPNILFLFSDQQRYDTVSCYGSPIVENLTPNLDRLAAQGVRFQYAFTPQPVCGPARSCLQTGKYATQTGCFRNQIALKTDEKTIAHYLAQAGYEVGYLGKWHLASTIGIEGAEYNVRTKPIPPQRRGGYKDFWLASDVLEFTSTSYSGHMFDAEGNRREFPKDRYRVDAQTDWLIEYLRNRNTDNPFFMFASYIEPHHQNNSGHFEGPKGAKERFAKYNVPGDLDGREGDWQAEMPDYLGCCKSLDDNVGRIVAELDHLGLTENTLIIYTSDHGCHFKTRNSEYKRTCHENTIHIPMIIKGPGFSGGKVISELVSLIDLTPTILKSAAAPIPDIMQGRPLQDLVDGDARDWPDDVFIQISETQVGRALRTKQWTYSVRAHGKDGGKDPSSDTYTEDFLYDNQSDPFQTNNLIDSPDLLNVRKELARRLIDRMIEAGEKKPTMIKKPQHDNGA